MMLAFPPGSGALSIARRLGTAPRNREGFECAASNDCPDVFELASGDYAIIGLDVSDDITLPEDAGRSAAERIVMVPRHVLLAAFNDLSGNI